MQVKRMELMNDYLEVCKPRVVLMMLVTVLVGMVLASETSPALGLMLATLFGVGACASSAAAVNHWLDRQIDARMKRTQHRPVADGRLSAAQVLPFAAIMGVLGLTVLVEYVNNLTALLTFVTLIGYAGIYTGYLKHATPQNIVIGGLAGAAPPLLGWTAVTNTLDPVALLLVLIIFTWTPPHFWALAIYREEEYKTVQVPMLPVVYGVSFTKKMIFLYSVLLIIVSELPFLVGMSGRGYALVALGLGGKFVYDAWLLKKTSEPKKAFQLFRYSIVYLFILFIAMLLDHVWRSHV
jgi:protoheme IX farnesyltransferase